MSIGEPLVQLQTYFIPTLYRKPRGLLGTIQNSTGSGSYVGRPGARSRHSPAPQLPELMMKIILLVTTAEAAAVLEVMGVIVVVEVVVVVEEE